MLSSSSRAVNLEEGLFGSWETGGRAGCDGVSRAGGSRGMAGSLHAWVKWARLEVWGRDLVEGHGMLSIRKKIEDAPVNIQHQGYDNDSVLSAVYL